MLKTIKSKIIVTICLLTTLLILGWVLLAWLFMFHYEVKVTDKQTTYSKQKQDSDNLVYTDKTTMKVDDTVMFFRYDSSDFYGMIKVGTCYQMDAYGYRIPLLGWYPNIISFKEITCK